MGKYLVELEAKWNPLMVFTDLRFSQWLLINSTVFRERLTSVCCLHYLPHDISPLQARPLGVNVGWYQDPRKS
jgi:hypothetical protein